MTGSEPNLQARPWTPAPWGACRSVREIKPYLETGQARHVTVWVPSDSPATDRAITYLIELAPEMAEAILDDSFLHAGEDGEMCGCGVCEVAEKLRQIGADNE